MLTLLMAACANASIKEIITLTGSSGTPNEASSNETDPTNAEAGWKFDANGGAYKWITPSYFLFDSGVEWSNIQLPSSGTVFYIRATLDSGSSPTSGDTVGSWLALSTDREWLWLRNTVGLTEGVLKIEIATDSGGTNIVATGYYKGDANVDSGA